VRSGKGIAMRNHSSIRLSDRINAAFIGADSKASEPRSASIHLLGAPTRAGRNASTGRRRVRQKLRSEMAELLTDIDGSPVLVRLLIKDIPAKLQSDLVFKGNDIHSLVSSILEKMVDRVRGPSLRSATPSKEPLAIVELISSGECLARLPALPSETVLRTGPLELDLLDRTAKRGDRKIDLRPREFQLLKYMMQRSDNLLTRATLLKEVWRYRFVPETNLVDVHMGRLRRKVDASNEAPMIRNVRGLGFILNAAPCSLSSPSKPAQRSGNMAVADQSPRSAERAVPWPSKGSTATHLPG
jgi:DNA-binding winged helix-turn-helix (wHTH) protein